MATFAVREQCGCGQGEITRQLYTAVEGAAGGSLTEGTEELPIRVRLSHQARANLDLIGTTELRSPIQLGDRSHRRPPAGGIGPVEPNVRRCDNSSSRWTAYE